MELGTAPLRRNALSLTRWWVGSIQRERELWASHVCTIYLCCSLLIIYFVLFSNAVVSEVLQTAPCVRGNGADNKPHVKRQIAYVSFACTWLQPFGPAIRSLSIYKALQVAPEHFSSGLGSARWTCCSKILSFDFDFTDIFAHTEAPASEKHTDNLCKDTWDSFGHVWFVSDRERSHWFTND